MKMRGSENKTRRKNERKGLLLLGIVILILSVTSIFYLMRSGLELYYLVALLWIVTVVFLLWIGNKYIFNYLDARFPLLQNISKRFFLQILISCFYSLLCINGTYYLFKVQTSLTAPDPAQFFVLNVYGLLFIIPVLAVNFSIYFVSQWKKAHLQSDQLREENLRTQLNSLRMQLDPHFLFNNLNVLSSLIEKAPRTAQDFLDKFADVYRYVLEYKKEELVALSTELEFIEAYVYLLEKRFGDQLQIEMPGSSTISDSLYIPPLSLQMLIENALKHNKISGEGPFVIQVLIENERWLTVKNTYRPKEAVPGRAGGTGLDNIRRRYEYLSSENLIIRQEESFFIVSLPLLEIVE